jgi:hypothetical protein
MGIMQFLSPNASRRKEIDGPSKLVGRLALYLILNFLLKISNELIEGSCDDQSAALYNDATPCATGIIPLPLSSSVVRDGSGGIPWRICSTRW